MLRNVCIKYFMNYKIRIRPKLTTKYLKFKKFNLKKKTSLSHQSAVFELVHFSERAFLQLVCVL